MFETTNQTTIPVGKHTVRPMDSVGPWMSRVTKTHRPKPTSTSIQQKKAPISEDVTCGYVWKHIHGHFICSQKTKSHRDPWRWEYLPT